MRIVDHVLDVPMTTRFGTFLSGAFRVADDRTRTEVDHLLIYLNLDREPCNLRLNSACYTSGLLGDTRCDCTWQLEFTLKYIQRYQQGLLIYHMHHEGRGNGVVEKFRSFSNNLHGARAFTVRGLPPDAREFESALLVVTSLGIRTVNLISNNGDKRQVLENGGVSVVRQIPVINSDPALRPYYDWKREDFNHRV